MCAIQIKEKLGLRGEEPSKFADKYLYDRFYADDPQDLFRVRKWILYNACMDFSCALLTARFVHTKSRL